MAAVLRRTRMLCGAHSAVARGLSRRHSSLESAPDETGHQDEFRTFIIKGKQRTRPLLREAKQIKRRVAIEPRYKRMSTEQDWTDVWPTAASFKASVFPAPVRQGAVAGVHENVSELPGAPPPKHANLELIKLPNFFHLTPRHIEKHCRSIRRFCSAWPDHLNTDHSINQHFPVQVIEALCLDSAQEEKMRRLVGFDNSSHVDLKANTVEIGRDHCPYLHQNRDYVQSESVSIKTEPWESMKQTQDMVSLEWDLSKARQNAHQLVRCWLHSAASQPDAANVPPYIGRLLAHANGDDEDLDGVEEVVTLQSAWTALFAGGVELNSSALGQYRAAVLDLLGIPADLGDKLNKAGESGGPDTQAPKRGAFEPPPPSQFNRHEMVETATALAQRSFYGPKHLGRGYT